MPDFFSKFPKIGYDFATNTGPREYTTVVDIMYRVNIIRTALNNASSYYEYLVEEGETPEVLADKLYGDPELHWVIMYANNIIDPYYDWPLDNDAFYDYITDKYGSIATAETTYSHWEKVVTRLDTSTGTETVSRFRINDVNVITADPSEISINDDIYPVEHYTGLAASTFQTYNLPDGTACQETITKNRVTFFDYEEELNDMKRSIKIINPDYISQIAAEFDNMTQDNLIESVGGLRTL